MCSVSVKYPLDFFSPLVPAVLQRNVTSVGISHQASHEFGLIELSDFSFASNLHAEMPNPLMLPKLTLQNYSVMYLINNYFYKVICFK